jgi:DNA-binding MarR family transcriptional regulator
MKQAVICIQLRILLREKASSAGSYLEQFGITLDQLVLLTNISSANSLVSAFDLGRSCAHAKVDVSRGLAALQRRGLITIIEKRKGVHRRRFSVTESGIALLEKLSKIEA